MVFQSSRSTFFMGKCGAFMLQNLVTMVKRSRAKGSPLYSGEPLERWDKRVSTCLGVLQPLCCGTLVYCEIVSGVT